MAKAKDVRTVVVTMFARMLTENGSLSNLLPLAEKEVADADRSLLKALAFGLARHSFELQAVVNPLLQKALKKKDLDVYLLMQVGVLQIEHMNVPTHAAVDATVSATKALRKPWAKGLVNAVLRNFIRQREDLYSSLSPTQSVAFPEWLYEELAKDWGDAAEKVFLESNLQAPMVLRANVLQGTAAEYSRQLSDVGIQSSTHAIAADAIVLESPVPVDQLPKFDKGRVSIQDVAAQLAVQLIVGEVSHSTTKMNILDACAAPGGKTAHLLESFAQSTVTALDISESRLQRVSESLDRLQLSDRAQVVAADAGAIDHWWDGDEFDIVLLDAPCSGTGVIRRHPDIKLLRRPTDINALVEIQTQLLNILWTTLKPGGLLMYATCSILKRENVSVAAAFLEQRTDATEVSLAIEGALPQECGNQLLPGVHQNDGFYYALLKKSV